MSIVEILVLLALVFFPLLQALLEKVGGGKREETMGDLEEPGGEAAPGHHEPVSVKPRQGSAERSVEEAGWSAGWGQWSTETLEELTAEEVVTEAEADELIAYQERVAEREVSEAARVTVPVVSMEALTVDRAAEHRRFHDRVKLPAPEAPHPLPPAERLDAVVRRRGSLRQAILLSEVLGAPRALKPLGSDPGTLQ